MADMTASGWYPSNVKVIRSWRPMGPNSLRHTLVKFVAEATNFGGGAQLYPGEGIPAPAASTVGFRESVEYIIPVAAFVGATGATNRYINWSCVPPTYGVSGGTVSTGCRLKLESYRVSGSASAAAGANNLEAVSSFAASDIWVTGLSYKAYGIFVGK